MSFSIDHRGPAPKPSESRRLLRFLKLGGQGNSKDVPALYWTIRAARYLGVAPWEMVRQPLFWREWALMCESCELEAKAWHESR